VPSVKRPSASVPVRPPLARAAAIAACVAILGVSAAGCETTQDKAQKQQARAEHILNARAEREKANKKKRHDKKHGKDKGSKAK
jgi:hypothetical protein